MPEPIALVGNLAADPIVRQTRAGDAVASFRVITSNRRVDRETGEWFEESTSTYSVSAFRKLGEHAAASLRKGSRVVVIGSLKLRRWEAGDSRGTDAEVRADAVGLDLRFGAIASAPSATEGKPEASPEQGWAPAPGASEQAFAPDQVPY